MALRRKNPVLQRKADDLASVVTTRLHLLTFTPIQSVGKIRLLKSTVSICAFSANYDAIILRDNYSPAWQNMVRDITTRAHRTYRDGAFTMMSPVEIEMTEPRCEGRSRYVIWVIVSFVGSRETTVVECAHTKIK